MRLSINVPEDLSEITLEQWQNFVKLEEPTDYDVLRCFYGIDTKGVFEMKANDVSRLVNHISQLLNDKPKELITSFKLSGLNFGFMPKLDDMTYGENTDLTKYSRDPKEANKFMAVIYRPIVSEQFGKYNIEDYKGSSEYSELMKQAPLSAYLSAQVFFWNLTNDLLNYIPTYLKEESQHLTAESGESMQALLNSLEINLRELTELQKRMFISV